MAINATDFIAALEEIEASKGIIKETILQMLEESLIKAYKKQLGGDDADVRVNIDVDKGTIELYQAKEVVDEVEDDFLQISVADANALDASKKYKAGDEFNIYASIDELRKATAMSVKSMLKQKFAEAEKSILYETFKDKIGTLITGKVEKVDDRGISVNIVKTSVYLPKKELIGDERFIVGETIKIYVDDVASGTKGAHIVVSRSKEGFLRCLFAEEIHDVYDGTVIIKGIAREAGERSKVAVYSEDPNIDPAGNCIGLGGTRIQKVVSQLGNGQAKEKIDVITWSSNPALFILEALKPARVVGIKVDEENKSEIVIVKDDSLSLAIGRKGVNARLAVKLTGYHIDIKVESEALEAGIEYTKSEEIEAMELEEKAKRISEAAKASLVYQKDTADGALPGVLEGYVAPQARKYDDDVASDVDIALEDEVDKEEDVKPVKVEEKKDEVKVDDAPKAEDVKEDDVKEVEVKTTTTLEDLEKSLESSSKSSKKSTGKKKTKKTEDTKAEDTVVRVDGPRMSIYSDEELAELDAEDEEDVIEDDEDIDYDEYDDYYDEK